MTEPHGNGAGPWILAGMAFAVPTTALVIVMARYWSPLLNFAVVGGAVAVALQLVRVLAPLHWHSTQNRMQRDAARTQTIVDAQVRPALPDVHREAALIQAQAAASASLGRAAAVWERMDTGATAAPRPPVPVRVWSDGHDNEGEYDDA